MNEQIIVTLHSKNSIYALILYWDENVAKILPLLLDKNCLTKET